MAALVLLRLSRYTGEDHWKEAADRQLEFLRAGARGDGVPVHLRLLRAGGDRGVPWLKFEIPSGFPSAFFDFLGYFSTAPHKLQVRWPV